MKTIIEEIPELLLSDARGIYIPRDFTTNFDLNVWHIDNKFKELDPDNEFYWDDWQEILDNAFAFERGVKWYLYQDGDLFAIPEDFDLDEWMGI